MNAIPFRLPGMLMSTMDMSNRARAAKDLC
jgi:hypothetical protein